MMGEYIRRDGGGGIGVYDCTKEYMATGMEE